jgi:hypothetical protein
MQQMIKYMQAHPHSRTTRVYVNLYVNNLKPGAYQDFWKKYLRVYKFAFYQKSELINKLLAGSIKQLSDIEDHAKDSNRTAKLLKK